MYIAQKRFQPGNGETFGNTLTLPPPPRYTVAMSGYYDGGHPMLPRNSPMFSPHDGGHARIAAQGGRTWMQDRADELRRRGCGVLMRILFPRPLRIVKLDRSSTAGS
jgi:hypothetical protein